MKNEKKYVRKYEPFTTKDYGGYTAGLTGDEIQEYLKVRASYYPKFKDIKPKQIYKKFCKSLGVHTGARAPDGESLTYRWDVERFANELFDGTETYWD